MQAKLQRCENICSHMKESLAQKEAQFLLLEQEKIETQSGIEDQGFTFQMQQRAASVVWIGAFVVLQFMLMSGCLDLHLSPYQP